MMEAGYFYLRWGDGYENVHICCTCGTQKMANLRLPIFLELPIRHKEIIHEPMLEAVNIRPWLKEYHSEIEMVSCGGESGDDARVCDFGWVLNTMNQCVEYDVSFHFHQTGYNFRRGGRVYHIPRKEQRIRLRRADLYLFHDCIHGGAAGGRINNAWSPLWKIPTWGRSSSRW